MYLLCLVKQTWLDRLMDLWTVSNWTFCEILLKMYYDLKKIQENIIVSHLNFVEIRGGTLIFVSVSAIFIFTRAGPESPATWPRLGGMCGVCEIVKSLIPFLQSSCFVLKRHAFQFERGDSHYTVLIRDRSYVSRWVATLILCIYVYMRVIYV